MKLFPDNTHRITAKGVVIRQFERGISVPSVAFITSCRPFQLMRILFILFLFTACTKSNVQLTDEIDSEIVLINMEEGDRAFIGDLLLTVDSCKPVLIGIDAWFVQEKDYQHDFVLANALKTIDNDILAYTLDSSFNPRKSHEKFREFVSAEGLAVVTFLNGLSSHFTPLTVVDDKVCVHFALKIVEWWQPGFIHDFEPNQIIPTKFTRTLDQFNHYSGSEITTAEHLSKLQNKIVLLGYIGPSNEDKHFTPIRSEINFQKNEPDTYGVVIIANQIRTILEYYD